MHNFAVCKNNIVCCLPNIWDSEMSTDEMLKCLKSTLLLQLGVSLRKGSTK